MNVLAAFLAVGLFAAGAALASWATDKLLDGSVGMAALTALSTSGLNRNIEHSLGLQSRASRS